jgi:putative methyltransferase (TIGR04325 family)
MLRKLIVDLTPPIVFRSLQKLYQRNRRDMSLAEPVKLNQKTEAELSTTFEGCYPSFESIPLDARGYDADDLAARTSSPFLELLKNAGNPGAKERVDQTGRLLILPLAVWQFIDGPLTVLDFGGSACLGLTQILDNVPHLNLKTFRYVNIDTPATSRFIREPVDTILKEKLGTSSFVTITEDIPETISIRPLVINVANSIQYVPDYGALLLRLGRLAPKVFIISFVPVSDQPTYCCKQTIHGHPTAVRIYNRAELICHMEGMGLRLAFTVNHAIRLTFKDTPGPFGFASMVFHRN